MTNADAAVIRARGLTKRYGSTVAVDDLSFDVLPGRVTGFLGPNGAGKSTTMRMILGLDLPTHGSVTVGGRPFGEHRQALRDVGAVLESRAVHPGRSAYHHLLCLAQSNGIDRRRVTDVLDLVGLDGAARRRAHGFSLGMSRRLGLAAALLGDPPVILCDEPVNGLDPEGIRWIRTFLRQLAAEGRTVFVSSHLMSEMALTADHVIVVGRGRLLADIGMAELLRDAASDVVLMRSPNSEQLRALVVTSGATTRVVDHGGIEVSGLSASEIGELAAGAGIALHELTPQQPSLEAAFLELTEGAVQFRGREAHA